jgi:hypothetical protein
MTPLESPQLGALLTIVSLMTPEVAFMLLESSIMLLESSIMFLESSIMLLENIYSAGITHDNSHLLSSYFYSKGQWPLVDFLVGDFLVVDHFPRHPSFLLKIAILDN